MQAGEMGNSDRSQQVRIIHLFLRDYFYSPSEGKFVPVPAMPEHLQSEICKALHALRCVDQGKLLCTSLQPHCPVLVTCCCQHQPYAILHNLCRQCVADLGYVCHMLPVHGMYASVLIAC